VPELEAVRLPALLALLTACTSGSGSGSVTGTISARSLSVRDAYFLPTSDPQSIQVFLTDTVRECTSPDSPYSFKSSSILELVIMNLQADMSLAPLVVGDYTVYLGQGPPPPGLVSQLGFSSLDSTCTDVFVSAGPNGVPATSGTTHLSSVSDTHVQGTFDVRFGSDHVTGTFEASKCSPSTGNYACH
jgi:hypothetical protein